MRFFRKPPSSPPQARIDGLLAYYGLGDWWLAAFTPKERDEIESTWGHIEFQGTTIAEGAPLTRGHIATNPLTPVEFLLVLVHRFPADSRDRMHVRIYARIMEKARSLAGGDLPGYVNGEHYPTVMERAKNLIRDGRVADADALVDAAFTASEAACRIGVSLTEPGPVPPAAYRAFAVLYRKQKDYAREVAILERYIRLPNGLGEKLQERLERARELLAKSTA